MIALQHALGQQHRKDSDHRVRYSRQSWNPVSLICNRKVVWLILRFSESFSDNLVVFCLQGKSGAPCFPPAIAVVSTFVGLCVVAYLLVLPYSANTLNSSTVPVPFLKVMKKLFVDLFQDPSKLLCANMGAGS
jgi:hypothetical protein